MSDISTNRPCGVLFDLDGVLLDSEGQYSIFWEQIDKEYPTGIDNFATVIKGTHLKRIMTHFPDNKAREEILDKLMDFERNMRFVFFPGALEFVKRLREAGIHMAIVTSSDIKKMRSLYDQHPEFPGLFDHIITGDMVSHSKPDPECFLLGAKRLGIDIDDCIVFEDSRQGLIAGRASGARVIGLATTLSADEVSPLCDLTIDAVSQLSVEQMLNTERRV